MSRLLAALVFVLVAVPVWAQAPVVNPTKIQWDYPDPAALVRYEVGYFLGTATEPFWQAPVELTAVQPVATGRYQAQLPRPAFGAFTAKIQAVGLEAGTSTEVKSGWSLPSNPFVLKPLVPANPAAVP